MDWGKLPAGDAAVRDDRANQRHRGVLLGFRAMRDGPKANAQG